MPDSKVHRVNKQVFPLLAPGVRSILQEIDVNTWQKVEEIRLREGRPLTLCWSGGEAMLTSRGQVSGAGEAYRVKPDDLSLTLQLISNCSLYAFEEELRRGYLTVPGGHRVGLSGKAVLEKGSIKVLRNINSLNFRIAREIRGIANYVIPYLITSSRQKPWSTLVISPPQAGKTTLLRDLVRCLSDGMPEKKFRGFKVGLVDERSEIAGCFEGSPQMDVGVRTDVLDGAPKGEGMMLLLRSMSPEIIVTDEIGREEDASSIEEMINAGVTVIASAHASTPEELYYRPTIKRLFNQHVFHRMVVLGRSRGPGTLELVQDPVRERNLYQPKTGGR